MRRGQLRLSLCCAILAVVLGDSSQNLIPPSSAGIAGESDSESQSSENCAGPTCPQKRASDGPPLTMSDSRARMLAEVQQGAGAAASGDASSKRLLVRGCDPVMAERARGFLPPLLGNVQLTSCTEDDTFLALLRDPAKKWDVVAFAPGAMRWDAAGEAIPGGNAETRGWTLERYKTEVRKTQGEGVKIAGTAEERETVPMLRGALGLA